MLAPLLVYARIACMATAFADSLVRAAAAEALGTLVLVLAYDRLP
jgi:hypothetical protein